MKLIAMLFLCIALGACGSMRDGRGNITTDPKVGSNFERSIATGLLAGAVMLPVGIPILAAFTGGLVGGFTDKETVNLGEPVWRWSREGDVD